MNLRKLINMMLASFVVILSSCEKMPAIDENENKNEKEIRVIASYASDDWDTKATGSAAATTDKNSIKSFKLHAWNGDSKFITGAKFDKKSATEWSDGNKYYWGTGTHTFVGITVDNVSGDYGTVSKGKVSLTNYSVSTGANDITTNSDEATVTQQDPCVAITTGTKSNTNVSLTFYHTLARVRVFANAEIASFLKVKAKFLGYEFRNVSIKGSATITNPSSISWTSVTKGKVRDNRFKTTGGVDITNQSKFTPIADNSWCNVIPSAVGTDMQIVIKVGFYDETTNALLGTRYFTGNPGATTFAAGKRYTYPVTIVNGGGDDSDGSGPDDVIDALVIKIGTLVVEEWDDDEIIITYPDGKVISTHSPTLDEDSEISVSDIKY